MIAATPDQQGAGDLQGDRPTGSRARIIKAAQDVFSERGYPQAGMREIAQRAGVATSLLTKYFGNKSRLFEIALSEIFVSPITLQGDRSRFGAALTETLVTPRRTMDATAMIALSLSDAEAREVAVRVAGQHIVAPLSEWLGGPDARERATNIMMMAVGFTMFHRNVDLGQSDAEKQATAAIFARSIQAIVDAG